jgi:hypothetical protein
MIMAPDNTNAKYTIWFGGPNLNTPIVYPGRFNTSLATTGTAQPGTAATFPLIPLTDSDLK